MNLDLYNKVIGIKNDLLYPVNSKMYDKEPQCNKTSSQQTNFVSALALQLSRFHCILNKKYVHLQVNRK